MVDDALNVCDLRNSDRDRQVFAAYEALTVDETMVVVGDGDPQPLGESLQAEYPDSVEWVRREGTADDRPGTYRVAITKRTATPLPRVLVNTAEIAAGGPEASGNLWKLDLRERGLDSNIIALPPHASIGAHTGAEVDVLVHVLAGNGTLTTEQNTVTLRPGALLWMPRRSRRAIDTGPDGLRYLTVHQHREISGLMPTVRQAV